MKHLLPDIIDLQLFNGKKIHKICRKFTSEYGAPWSKDEIPAKLNQIEPEKKKLKAMNLLIEYFIKVCKAVVPNKEIGKKNKREKNHTSLERN